MNKPNLPAPYCCGREAIWTVQSVNLAYYYCQECRKEVAPVKEEDSTPVYDDWDPFNGGFMMTQTPITGTSPTYQFRMVVNPKDGHVMTTCDPQTPTGYLEWEDYFGIDSKKA